LKYEKLYTGNNQLHITNKLCRLFYFSNLI